MATNDSSNPATEADQSFTGTAGADTLSGGLGNDTISAGGGDDVLSGDGAVPGAWLFEVFDRNFLSANGQAFDIELGTRIGTGYVSDFNEGGLASTLRGTGGNPNDFGVIYTSTLNITTGGTYRFTTTSDDGSTIQIFDSNGDPVQFVNQTGGTLDYLNNDFHQGSTTRFGDAVLDANETYTIQIRYWENGGRDSLSGTISGPDTGGASQDLLTSPLIGLPPGPEASVIGVPGGVEGNDLIDGGAGNDSILGNGGDDTLIGGLGDDTLDGGDGNDSLSGGEGSDTLLGGAGLDTLNGGAGADSIFGDTGQDSVDYSDSDAGIFVDLTTGTAVGSGGHAQGDTLTGVDGIIGSDFADVIIGFDAEAVGTGFDDFTNVFEGGAGDDFLAGLGGGDALDGGADNDTIFGGLGADTLFGGDGDDTFFFFAGDGDDTIGDFNFGGTGALDDGDQTNNDFIDLSPFYTNVFELRADFDDDGVLNQSTGDFSDNVALGGSLTLTGVSRDDLTFDTTNLACFVSGTRIDTVDGPVAVEELRVGMLLPTLDHGDQPVRAILSSRVCGRGVYAPIRIRAGALGNRRDLLMSPAHRMLLCDWRAQLLTGEDEVLVSASNLMRGDQVHVAPSADVTYFHILLDRHEIIFAEGAPTESFHPEVEDVIAADQDSIAHGALRSSSKLQDKSALCARPVMRGYQARALLEWRQPADVA